MTGLKGSDASGPITNDRGVTIEAIALASFLVLVVSTVLAGFAVRGVESPRAHHLLFHFSAFFLNLPGCAVSGVEPP